MPQVDSAAFITQLIGFIVTYYGLYAVLVGLVLPKMQWHMAIRRGRRGRPEQGVIAVYFDQFDIVRVCGVVTNASLMLSFAVMVY